MFKQIKQVNRYAAPGAADMKKLADFYAQGKFNAAEHVARKLMVRFPLHPYAWKMLGVLLEKSGKLDEALVCKRKAAALDPDDAGAHHNLGNAWMKKGRFSEAEASYRRVIALSPRFSEAHRTLANALKMQGLLGAAETSYRDALAIDPADAFSHVCLGHLIAMQYRPDDALEHFRMANTLDPGYAPALSGIGVSLLDQGHTDKAVDFLRSALEQHPDNAEIFSQFLCCQLHDTNLGQAELYSLHLAFADRFEKALRVNWQPHANVRDPSRRLKIGFVSGDLRAHAVSSFIEPVWAALDPACVELHAYANHWFEDTVTSRLRQYVAIWRQVHGLSDKALAELIRSDGIDILIDLSGHTANNRLVAFAHKPAPVQATWIGYPGTTGLCSMDYLICDPFNAPHGLYERFHSEQFARLPSAIMFTPSHRAPAVNDLPALKNGYVTFASFNRRSKLGKSVIQTWSRVLKSLPASRLLLGHMDGATAVGTLRDEFADCGVAAERLDFRPKMPMGQYLALHHEADIVLDSWPYSGGTTTNHALWMGVPVVSMRGSSRVHGQSAASIGRTGLGDWVVENEADFVRLAVARASDLPALANVRSSMRARWLRSPWRNHAVIARGLEAGFRAMWQRWCAGLPAEHFEIKTETVG